MTPRPLEGRVVLVTRPEPECHHTARQVAELGGTPLLAPALVVRPPLEPGPFVAAMGELGAYQGVILTSVNGARAFLQALPAASKGVPPLYAVGEKSAEVVRAAGYAVRVPPQASHGEALAAWMVAGCRGGERFLFPRAEEGREELVTRLREAGCQVDLVTAYRTEALTALPEQAAVALARGEVDAITFFSGRSAEAFLQVAPCATWGGAPVVVALSPVTGETLLRLGVPPQVMPRQPTSEFMLAALAEHWQRVTVQLPMDPMPPHE